MGTFNPGGAEVLCKAASLRHLSTPLRALRIVRSLCSYSHPRVPIDRILDITSPTQNISLIHVSIGAGLFRSTMMEGTTNMRGAVFGFVRPFGKESRLR